MGAWHRRRSGGLREGSLKCAACGQVAAVFCDGVRAREPYRICNRALCQDCATPHGQSHFCPECARHRGLAGVS